jgi:hypothetical protein
MPEYITKEQMDWLVVGVAHSYSQDPKDISNPNEAETTLELEKAFEEFEVVLEGVLAEELDSCPTFLEEYCVEDVMACSAPLDVLMTLNEEGVGIWDGRWDHFFEDPDDIERLERRLKERLQKYADFTGGGSLNEALMKAAFESTGNMDKY